MSGDGGEEKVVCVTGASGYIASWIVKFLLERGYTVKATVRDPNDPKRTEHLRAIDGANERLHLFKAELLEQGVFDSVVDGCEAVFHTASPAILSSINPQVIYEALTGHRVGWKKALLFLKAIILSRLKGIEAFEKQAIEFASRKVAAISGDALDNDEAEEETEELTNQVLDEIGVDIASQLSAAPKNKIRGKKAEDTGSSGVDEIEKRLAALRNPCAETL